MRILALDIGGFTQDILLFDSSLPIENCIKLIMPSPTQILAKKIRTASRMKRDVLLTGVDMGGGPSKWALLDHLKSGCRVYATADAAATFDDDLDEVASWGVRIINNERGIDRSRNVVRIETKDLDLLRIRRALQAFDADYRFDALAVAVLDHGFAPKGVSDRRFRFQYLREVVTKRRDLMAFAYLKDEVPSLMTRMKAVVHTAESDLPLLVMDTPLAAVIGSLEDREVVRHAHKVIINVGNFHTLAFHLYEDTILGLFEHHTECLDSEHIDALVTGLVRGTLSDDEVYDDGGHGCVVMDKRNRIPFVSVIGPRRAIMAGSKLAPYFAAPHGDMMLTGCFGLVRALLKRLNMDEP